MFINGLRHDGSSDMEFLAAAIREVTGVMRR
jgi:hypothetical protein